MSRKRPRQILAAASASFGDAGTKRRTEMLLATTTVEDFDRFTSVFSTQGAEKRRQYGSKGAPVFRDPNREDRGWVIFDWDLDGWQNFASDPTIPPIMKEPGHKGRPDVAEFVGRYGALEQGHGRLDQGRRDRRLDRPALADGLRPKHSAQLGRCRGDCGRDCFDSAWAEHALPFRFRI
jgi:hypothetical protein